MTPPLVGSIPAAALAPRAGEVAARLGTTVGYHDELTRRCESSLRDVIDCRFAALRVPIAFPDEGKVDLGFAVVESRDLCRNLATCREAFLFAVTLGVGVDRLLARLAVTSSAEHFVTDALASAFAEAACDAAEREIVGACRTRPRYSPGYGDLSLSTQKGLLAALGGEKIGITLSRALLMTPVKSITAIKGILE